MTDTLVFDAAERLFGDLATEAVVNAAEAGTWPAALWQAVDAAGFLDVLVAGAAGFDLGGFGDAAQILRAAGRHAVPLPLAETMLARWWLAGAGLAVPQGPLTVAPVEPDDTVAVTPARRGCRVSGRAGAVPWATQAAGIVVVAAGYVALVVPSAADVRAGTNLAGEPRDEVAFELDVTDAAAAPVPSAYDATLLLGLGAACRAQQIAGALETALELAVRYANDRVQFGRPLAKFQAIQHQLALAAEQAGAARVAADGASAALAARGGDAVFAVAAAKIRAGEAAGKLTDYVHQVHGAIGFTHEHRLHHATRRLWSWRDEFGTESHWSVALGRRLAAAGGGALWPTLTAE
ncbi:MAG TPA: acyl-CoA dehydrogenase family protein [Candidatus Sulfotelmatobacter sp.]|nr:acyl-CoA dehydrogenase family protein [Candidatus Sulfotelmatobacter sp.]